jgi:hypothetical protein
MKTLVKYPSRARPDLFKLQVCRYLDDPTVTMLVSIDADDATMNNPAMLKWLDTRDERLTYRVGNSKSKVEAINDGLVEADWQLCILASDDMVPRRPDYAQRIAQLFAQEFPDDDGVLHLNDGRVGKTLNTLCIVGRPYFNRFGYLYHPDYKSLWCDNEFMEVSQRLGRAAYVDEIVIRHEWVRATGRDKLHLRNESFNSIDARTFHQRKKAGFPK